MKKQLHLFLTAVMFYTRIPVPGNIGHSDEKLNKSTKYFPFMGWIVGAFGALIFYLSLFVIPISLAVILSMISTILLTGAFHEDGFADSCDAFGGGWTKEKILEIMKDSRIGTYGSVGLILILATKYLSIINIDVKQIPLVLISAHAFSRYIATGIIFFSEYAREDNLSKSKPVGKSMNSVDYLIAFIFGSTPLFALALIYSYWFLLILFTAIPLIYF